MATTTQKSGSVVQTWLPHPLDNQLRQHCADERRSLSSVIRLAVEDRLQSSLAPSGEEHGVRRVVGSLARRDADAQREEN